MAFQGKEFTPEMKQLIVNLKLHFDEEKKTGRLVSTRNATGRVAHGLGVGEATVKRVMAAHKQGKSLVVEEKERGRPPCRLSLNLQPVIREFIRQKNLKGQKISAEQIREYLLQKHSVEIPMSTLLRSLSRLGFTYGVGKRRTALKEQDYVVLARRRYLRRKITNRNNDGSLKRPEVYLEPVWELSRCEGVRNFEVRGGTEWSLFPFREYILLTVQGLCQLRTRQNRAIEAR